MESSNGGAVAAGGAAVIGGGGGGRSLLLTSSGVSDTFQKCLFLTQQYLSDHGNLTNLSQLEVKLDALHALLLDRSTCASIDPHQLLLSECLHCMVNAISLHDTPIALLNRFLRVLNTFVQQNFEARRVLQDQLQLCSILAPTLQQFLRQSDDSVGIVSKCFDLLQSLTYYFIIDSSCAIQDLVFCSFSEVVLNSPPQSKFLSHSLAVLTNLCLHSEFAKQCIKNMQDSRQFYRKLSDLLQHNDNLVVICALSLLSCLDESLRERVFNKNNIFQTLQCIFNVLMKGGRNARRYAADLLIRITQQITLIQALLQYPHFQTYLKELSTLLVLVANDDEDILKVYELLLYLCGGDPEQPHAQSQLFDSQPPIDVEQPMTSVHKQLGALACRTLLEAGPVTKQLQTPLLTISQAASLPAKPPLSQLPTMALKLMNRLMKEVLVNQSSNPRRSVQDYLSNDVLCSLIDECIKASLNTQDPQLLDACRRQRACLELVTVLCRDERLCSDICEVLTAPLCAHLAEFQMLSNPLVVQPSLSTTVSSWGPVGVDILLELIEVLKCLSRTSRAHNELLDQLLHDHRLFCCVAFAVTSAHPRRVAKALKLLKSTNDTEFTWLSEMIVASSRANRSVAAMATTATTPVVNQHPELMNGHHVTTNGYHHHHVDNNINTAASMLIARQPRVAPSTSNTAAAESVIVDKLIDQFKNGMQLKDARITQVIEVYERKIASMKARHEEMAQLSDWQIGALRRAERLLAGHRGERNNCEEEAARIRNLLLESELQSEVVRKQLKEREQEREKLESNLSTMRDRLVEHEKVLAASRDQENAWKAKIENLNGLLKTAQSEIENERKMQTLLRGHYDKMKQNFNEASEKLELSAEEVKSLKKQVKEKDDEVERQKVVVEKLENVAADREESNLRLEKNVEKLQANLHDLEMEKKTLRKQVTENELALARKEARLKEQDSHIKRLDSEVEKFSSINAMIRKLTASEQSQQGGSSQHQPH